MTKLLQSDPVPIREPSGPAEAASGIQPLRHLHAVLTTYSWSNLMETGRCACEFSPDYYDEPEQEGGEPIPKSIRYRWPDATRDEVLARLLKLNAERANRRRWRDWRGRLQLRQRRTRCGGRNPPLPRGRTI